MLTMQERFMMSFKFNSQCKCSYGQPLVLENMDKKKNALLNVLYPLQWISMLLLSFSTVFEDFAV